MALVYLDLVDNVVTKDKKTVLACITMFKDWENEDAQLSDALELRNSLIEAYRNHPDGEVVVKLTVKEECVNI
jgi:hypothetical protein